MRSRSSGFGGPPSSSAEESGLDFSATEEDDGGLAVVGGSNRSYLRTRPKLTCASAAWLRRAPPVPTGVAMALLLFEPFLEPPPLPPTTKVLEPFEELADDIDMVLCFRTGEEGAEDEENPSPDNAPPWRPLTSRLEEEFFILDLTSR